ncbi:MAG: 2-amino-4-hydroxy-6-hydroxymethyldihydropteridine diphosphokinase [Rhodobiaceae bacterium]|nr:2-amino-4-hydroxy-6-hydroxymethyldihydropteridine diphosphokinase [Rhodobiaceae bacterium]MCC0055715.1 2-amino-4-hydroxy-6-hydroxymethyldihydropteridine diphosphokinase [Rhodobiaceae bacterium]
MEAGFSLGSNLGDRAANIESALEALFDGNDIAFLKSSSIYQTPPWGVTDQPAFLNACAVGETELAPDTLLARVKMIERDLGRQPGRRWGPRLIDIDILFLGNRELAAEDLAIPHRELFNRAFVLIPLAEIRPDLVLSGRRIADAAATFANEPVERVSPPWSPASAHDR